MSTDEAKAAAEAYLNELYVFMGTEQEKLVKAFLAGVEWRDAHPNEAVREVLKGLIGAAEPMGGWLSAALEDANVCAALAKYRKETK